MVTYGLTITMVKVSILLLYRRIFDTREMRLATLIVGFMSITWLFADVFTIIFLCSPISSFWNPKLMFSDDCGDIQAYLSGVSISNLLIDMIILSLPMTFIWNLQLTTKRKITLCCLFLLGGLYVFKCFSFQSS